MCACGAFLSCSLVSPVAETIGYVVVAVFGGVVCEKRRIRQVLVGPGVGVREHLCELILKELMCCCQNASRFPNAVIWCPMRVMQSILG